MKRIGRIIGLLIGIPLILVLCLGIYAWTTYAGLTPVPRFAVSLALKEKDLSKDEIRAIHRTMNAYGVVARSDSRDELKSLTQAAAESRSTEEIDRRIADLYESLTPETREALAEQLELPPGEFAEAETVLDRAVDRYRKTGRLTLTSGEQNILEKIAGNRGIDESTWKTLSSATPELP